MRPYLIITNLGILGITVIILLLACIVYLIFNLKKAEEKNGKPKRNSSS